MSTSMIRGYGLPSEGASSYNGLRGFGRFGNGASCCVSPARRRASPLFRTLPDPELGGMGGGFGDFGIVLGTDAHQEATAPFSTPSTLNWNPYATPSARDILSTRAAGGGAGVAVLGLGALALFFFLR